MTLEAAIFHPHDVLAYGCKDLCSLAAVMTSEIGVLQDDQEEFLLEEAKIKDLTFDYNHQLEMDSADFGHDNLCGNSWESSSLYMLENIKWELNSSPNIACAQKSFLPGKLSLSSVPAKGKRKRRRPKSFKNKEEMENQRMTHIAVERNRRKQMNEYLAVIRCLMPNSYVQKFDQASIVGGAINFVKELEQQLHHLEARKRITQQQNQTEGFSPLADFLTFTQLTSTSNSTRPNDSGSVYRSSMADIEVTMFETHANLKVLTKKRPKQLLKMASGLQGLHLTVLHLSVTTIDEMILYSISLKVEDDCGFNSVDKIVEAIHQIIERIQCEKIAERS